MQGPSYLLISERCRRCNAAEKHRKAISCSGCLSVSLISQYGKVRRELLTAKSFEQGGTQFSAFLLDCDDSPLFRRNLNKTIEASCSIPPFPIHKTSRLWEEEEATSR